MHQHNQTLSAGRRFLAALLILFFGMGSYVDGQTDLTTDEDIEELGEFIIVGTAYATSQAVNSKRETAIIADSVVSDDIGKLPDHNVADVLRRVPGVTTIMDEGEGRYVTIRGLSPEFTNITVDGVKLSSVAAPWDAFAKATVLEAIPAASLEQIVVKKTLTPDMSADAIGGTVNLKSRGAFDRKANYLSASGGLGYYSMDDMPKSDNGPSYKADVYYSTILGNDEQWGVSGELNYNLRDSDELKTIRTGYRELPSGEMVTGDYWNYIYGNKRERKGGSVKLEFMPAQKSHTYLSVRHYTQRDDEDKYGHYLRASGKHDEPTSTINGASGRSRYFNHDIKRKTTTYLLGSDYYFDDNTKLTASYSISDSEWEQPNQFIQYDWQGPGLNGTYDSSGFVDLYHLDGPSQQEFRDPENYQFTLFQLYDHNSSKDLNEFRLDWDSTQTTGRDWGYKLGVTGRDEAYEYDYERGEYRRSGFSMTDYVEEPTDWVAPGMSDPFIFLNKDAFLNDFDPSEDGWTFNDRDPYTRDYQANEKVLAGYAMATYFTEKMDLIGGVRYEHTDWDSTSFENADPARPVTIEGDYSHLLPSFLANYRFNDSWVIRAGYSQSIGRPDYKDLGVPARFDDVDGDVTLPNPDLKPRESNNYDLSLEYYFPQNLGLLSLAVFYKDISNEIYTQREFYEYRDPGTGEIINPDATINQPVNAGKGKTSGFEASYQMAKLPMLPGALSDLGFSVNYTHNNGELELIDSGGDVVRTTDSYIYQPEKLINLNLFFSRAKYELRLAYNHTDHYYDSFHPTDTFRDDRWNGRDQWDFHARYNINDSWVVTADFSNFTDEARVRQYGDEHLREFVDFGRSIWIGTQYRY